MAKSDATVRSMIDAARARLQADETLKPDDYRLRYVMANAEPKHTALQQQQAITALMREFKDRK